MTTFWVVEMESVEMGDIADRRVFDTPERLADYVRVNALDARCLRIAMADEGNLVELRITEAFE